MLSTVQLTRMSRMVGISRACFWVFGLTGDVCRPGSPRCHMCLCLEGRREAPPPPSSLLPPLPQMYLPSAIATGAFWQRSWSLEEAYSAHTRLTAPPPLHEGDGSILCAIDPHAAPVWFVFPVWYLLVTYFPFLLFPSSHYIDCLQMPVMTGMPHRRL